MLRSSLFQRTLWRLRTIGTVLSLIRAKRDFDRFRTVVPRRPLDHDSGFAQSRRSALELARKRIRRLWPALAEGVARLFARLPEIGSGLLDFRPVGIFPRLVRLGVGGLRLPHRTANVGNELGEQLGCDPVPLAALDHEQPAWEG